jgi:hypothetical protein
VVAISCDQLFSVSYSFRLIGPQTKQGYIHRWSVKIGFKKTSTAQARGWRAVCEPGQGLSCPAGHHSRREEAVPLSSRCVRTVKKVLDTVFPPVYRLTVLYLPMVFHHLHTDKKENKNFLIYD